MRKLAAEAWSYTERPPLLVSKGRAVRMEANGAVPYVARPQWERVAERLMNAPGIHPPANALTGWPLPPDGDMPGGAADGADNRPKPGRVDQ